MGPPLHGIHSICVLHPPFMPTILDPLDPQDPLDPLDFLCAPQEMRDAFEEVGQVLGGLHPAEGDDDELAAELDAMCFSPKRKWPMWTMWPTRRCKKPRQSCRRRPKNGKSVVAF